MSSWRYTILISLLVLVCSGSNWQLVSARVFASEGRLIEGLKAGGHSSRQLHQFLSTAGEEELEELEDSPVKGGSGAAATELTQSLPASGGQKGYIEEEPLGAEEGVGDYEDEEILPGALDEEGDEDYSDITQPDPELLDIEGNGQGSSKDPLALPIAAHMGAEAVEEAKRKSMPLGTGKEGESTTETAALSKSGNASQSTSQLVDARRKGKQGVPGNSSVSAVTIPSMGGNSYSAEAIETNNQGKGIQDPMPGSHSSMSSKGMSTEKSGSATASEGSTLTSLAQKDKPVNSDDLDSSLASEKATETFRLEESGDPKPKRASTKSGLAAAGLQGTGDAASLQDHKDEGSWVEPEDEPAVSTVQLGSFGDNLQSSSQASSSIQQQGAAGLPDSTASLDAMPSGTKPAAATNSSLLAQGAILGSAVRDMVANSASNVASSASNVTGTAAVVLGIIAGTAVAGIGICLYRRCRQGKGKPSPRIIEIGNLTRGSKSPSYSRVNGENREQRSSGSGSKWEDWDSDSWETLDSARNLQHKTKEKGKKAWDWDNDF